MNCRSPSPFSNCTDVVMALLVTLSRPKHWNIFLITSLAASAMWFSPVIGGEFLPSLWSFCSASTSMSIPCPLHLYFIVQEGMGLQLLAEVLFMSGQRSLMGRTEIVVLRGSGILPHSHWSLELNQDENPKPRVSPCQWLSLNSTLPTQRGQDPSSWKCLLGWFRCVGSNSRPYNWTIYFQSYCFNWLIHWTWSIRAILVPWHLMPACTGAETQWYPLVSAARWFWKELACRCDSFVEAKHIFCDFPPTKTAQFKNLKFYCFPNEPKSSDKSAAIKN